VCIAFLAVDIHLNICILISGLIVINRRRKKIHLCCNIRFEKDKGSTYLEKVGY